MATPSVARGVLDAVLSIVTAWGGDRAGISEEGLSSSLAGYRAKLRWLGKPSGLADQRERMAEA